MKSIFKVTTILFFTWPFEKESLLFYWSEHNSSVEVFTLELVADLLLQAAQVLFYIHRHGLIHQYVRLSSCMLRSSARSRKRMHLLLTDFWFADITSVLLEAGQIAQDLSIYLAPEQLEGRIVAASDQYALAILIYELLLGYRLSQVDISLGLYERFLIQRAVDLSVAELEIARRIDAVLVRALSVDVSARYATIEEFAQAFKAVSQGEASEVVDDITAKLSYSVERLWCLLSI